MPVFSPVLIGNRLPYQLPEPQQFDSNSWLQVSAFNNFAAGITSNNLLYAWGVNNVYQVGDGTTQNKSLPVQISASSFMQVSAGFDHSGAITTENRLFVWGNQPSIQTLTVNQSWTSINNGGDHFLAIRNDGALFAWGFNDRGQIGDNSTLNKSSPVQLGTSSWSQVSAGYYNSAALTTTGQLFVWGLNSAGQLGQNNLISRSSPIQVTAAGVSSWIAVTSGNQYYFAIDSTNRLFGWGLNNLYQLGLGDQMNTGWRSNPVQIGTSSWIAVSAGGLGDHTTGIDVNGNLYIWGNFNSVFAPIPTTIYSWTQLSAGGQHTSGIRNDNTLWVWGLNTSGQLGQQNTTLARSSPVQITSSSFTTVSSKFSHGAAIRSDNALLIWGFNAGGGLGLGTTVNRSSPVVVSNALDTSSYAYTMFNVNSVYDTTLVPIAGSVSGVFDGTSFLTVDNAPQLVFGTNNFTIEFWVYLTNTSVVLLMDFRPASTNGLYPAIYTTSSTFRLFVNGSDRITSSTYTINTWYHLAIVRISSTTTMYVNGVAAGIYVDSNSYLCPAARPIIGASGFSLGSNAMTGYLSNIRITNGVGVYTNTFTVPTSILTATQSSGVNINAITAGQTVFLTYTTFAASITATNYSSVATGTSNTAAIRNDNTIWIWGDNSSGQLGNLDLISRSNPTQLGNLFQLVDSSLNNFPISNFGTSFSTTNVPSLTGGPVSGVFDTTGYIVASSTIYTFGTGVWTAECWVRFDDLSTTRSIFGLAVSGTNGAFLSRNSNNGFTISSGDPPNFANATSTASASNLITSTSVWYHIAWTRSGATSSVYLDGVAVINAGAIRSPFATTPTNIYVGIGFGVTNGNYSPLTPSFFGKISNVRVTWGKQVYTGTFTVPTAVLTTSQSAGVNISAISPSDVALLTYTTTSSFINAFPSSWSSVDAGDRFFVAKKPDGTLWAWGLNTSGQVGVASINNRSSPAVVASGSWLQFSVGFDHTLAIRADNTLWTWGNFNAIGLVTEVQSWSTVAAGGQNSLAIKSDGTLWGWGANAQGQVGDFTTVLKNSPVNIAAASWSGLGVGNSSSFAIDTVGALYAWGWNSSGQLGIGNSLNRSSPTQITFSGSWTLVKPGFDHVEAIDTLGRLYAWGNFTTGQTGVQIFTTDSWVAIANGLALRADNTLWSWGSNPGDGTTIIRSSPIQIGTNEWTSIALTYQSTFAKAAIKIDNTLYMWGDNSNGQLGLNDTINRSSPVQVTGSWLQVSTQLSNTAAINSSNIIFTWGNNSTGQLGDNSTINKSSPVLLASPFNTSNWTNVSVGYSHMAAIRSDGALYLWGFNNRGQLGNNNPGVSRSNPVLTALTTSSFVAISAGASHNIAIRAIDRALFGWGAPWGNGTAPSGNNISAPQQIGTSSWASVAAGADSSYAITMTGQLWAWGTNANGLIAQNINFANFNAASVPIQLGSSTNFLRAMPAAAITSANTAFVWGPENSAFNNTTLTYSSLVQVGSKLTAQFYSPQQVGSSSWTNVESGSSFTVAIDANNLLYGWGLNTSGQLGDRTTLNRSSPTLLNSSSWIAIAAEFDHVLAIRSDTTLWTWGNSTAIGLVTYPQSWSQISAGWSHTLGIRSDGALFTWGLNSSGQLGTGNLTDRASPTLLGFNFGLTTNFIGASSWSQISAGNNFSLAIDVNNRMFAWGLNTSFQLGDGYNISKSLPVQIGYSIVDQSTYGNVLRSYGQFVERGVIPFNDSISIQCNPSLVYGIEYAYRSNIAVWFDADYCMECWVFPITFTVENNRPLLISHGFPWAGIANYWSFGFDINGSLTFYYFNGGGVTVSGGGGASLNTWQHISMTYTNSTGVIRLYHNGLLVGFSTKQGTPQTDTRYELNIGALSGVAFNGYISNIRIVKGNVVYTGEFNPPTSPLTAIQSAGPNINAIIAGQTSLLVLTSPASVTSLSWTSISAGGDHALAVASNGNLFSWGNNDNGQAGRFNAAQSWSFIAANSTALGFSAIRNDGLLFVWGANDQSQLGLGDILARSSPVQLGVNSWTSVSIGRHHALAIRNDGTLWAWGYNNFGQLGVNNLVSQGSPVQITAIAGSWSSVTAGWIQSYGITTTGNLYAWGYNAFGLLGLGDIISRSVPTQITTPSASWIQVAAGASAVAAITSTNIIYTWGLNSSGQLGNNTVVSRSSPTLLAAPFNTSNFTAVAVNQNHMLGLLNNGALYAWGLNDVGQLGNNTTINRSNPTLVVASNSWTLITVTGNSSTNAASLAIATNGSLWAWGGNATGMLGDSTVVNKSSPIQIGTSSWSLITAGDQSVLARRLDNTIFAWGLGSSGQIGNNVAINVSSPVQIGNLPDMNRWSPVQVGNSSWTLASAGVSFSSGIDSAGGLYGWGLNTSRQVGDNTTVSKFSPVVIASGSWTKVDAGASHSLAIRNDGSLWGWGIGSALNINNVTPFSWSQLSNSSGNTNNVLAIRNDGSLWGWGNNGAGSLGDNSGVSKSSPVLIDSGSWTSVSVGANHSAAIKQGGTLFIWGLNSSGQLGLTDVVSRSNPTQLDSNSWSSVSTGFNATAAIRGNQLYVWGDNSNGQLGINSVSLRSSPVQIAGSWTAVALGTQQQALALNYLNDLFGWGYNGEFNLGNNSNVSRSSPIQISSYTKFTTLRSGERHSIAIDTNNKVWVWGNQDMLQTDVNSWTQIAYGESHAIALRSDGRMFGWGQNVYGQLGTNDAVNKSSPVLVGLNPSSTSWVSVFATAYSSYGITSLGTLYAWGEGGTGAIGDGTTISRSNPTVVFSGDTKFLGLQTGAFVDTTDIHRVNPLGTTIPVISMVQGGYNGYSVSFGGTGYLTAPLIGANFFNIPAATNWSFECFIFLSALPTAGNVYVVASRNWTYPTTGPTWGFSITSAGVLQWNYAFTGVAAQVLIQSAASAITTSSWIHLAFVKNTSNLASMYINGVLSTSATDANAMTSATGDLFIGVASNLAAASFFNGFISDVRIVTGVAVYTGAFTTPTRPLTITQSSGVNISALAGGIMSQVTGGTQYAMALTTTGKLYTWGTGSSGQLGNNSTINRSSPVIVTANGASFVSISSGNNYSAAVDSNGALYTWGLQNAFTLVLGTGQSNAVTSRSTPVQIAPTISWTTVSLGYSHGAAIDSNSRLYLWGLGTATNLTTQTVSWTQIAVGEGGSVSTETHALAIRSDGLLYSWGNNTFGQLGTFDQGVRSSPTLVAGAFGVPGSWYGSWTNITAGAGHSLGVNSDGRVYTWGQNNNGQLGLNDTINRSAPTLMPQALFLPTNFVEQISNSQATVNAFVSFTTDNTLYPGAITLSTTSTPNSGRATTPGNANLLMTGDFTIEFYLQSTNNGAINQTIRLPGTDGWWFRWLIAANANLEFYITQTAWNAGTPTLVATSAIAINIWYHIAVTRLGSTIRLWVNGVSVATGTYVGNVGDAANALIYADGDGTGAAGSNQNINNVRIVNGTALYTEAFVPYRGPFTRVFGSQTVVLSLTTGVTLTGTPSINRLAAGEFHSAITFNNGSLYTFGVNSAGQLGDGTTINKSSPVLIGSAANSYTQISTGLSYTIALRSNGTLWAWGLNSSYQLGDGTTLAKSSPVLIGGSNSFTSISSGANHNLAISSNFNLWTWGDVNSIILQNTDSPVSWTQITQGDAHTLGIRGDGILFTWGLNNVGQLGDGTTVNKSSPVIIGNSSYSAIGAGQSHSFAIRVDGAMFAWGLGTSGQLGDNTAISKSSPVLVQAATISFTSVTGGALHSSAVDTLGRLYVWGANAGGQLGTNDVVGRSNPLQLGTNSWRSVSAGISNTLAVRNDYSLWSWGLNTSFQLGDGTSITKSSPVQIGVGRSWNVISSEWDHSAAITSLGKLNVWGPAGSVLLPTAPLSWAQIASGSFNRLGIREDGSLWAWGNGGNGAIGDGTTISKSSPVLVSADWSWNAVAAGQHVNYAIRGDGGLFAWGLGINGVLGNNSTVSRSSPVQIGTNSWVSISASTNNFAIAKRADGTIWTWGLNGSGQLGDNTTITKSSPVQVGSSSWKQVQAGAGSLVVGIFNDDKLYVWGNNFQGNLGLNDTVDRSNPTQLGTESYIVISAGAGGAGIRPDNTLFVWGPNTGGKLGQNDTAARSSPVQIAGSWTQINVASRTFGIKTDGTLWSIGNNNQGQLGDGTTITKSSPVQIGTSSWTSINVGLDPGASINNIVYFWGQNQNVGTFGFGDTIDRSSPVILGSTNVNITTPYIIPTKVTNNDYSFVSVGSSFTVALATNNTAFAWGFNTSGQIGDNTVITKSSPVSIGTFSWTKLSSGSTHTVAIDSIGNAYTWGLNSSGQFGNNSTINRSSPTLLGNPGGLYTQIGIPKIINNTLSYAQIAAGASHSFVRTVDNLLYTWGNNTNGQLGTNDVLNRSNPTLISSSSPVLLSAVQIAAGRNISTLLNSANLLFTWGINSAGQIGQNDLLSRSMPTQINLTAVPDSGTAIPTLVQRNNIVVSDLSTNNLRLSYQLGAAPISFGPFTPSSSIALNLQRSGGAVNNCENVITPSIPSFNIGSYSDYTIECWVYFLDNAGLPHFYSMGISGVEARTRWYIQTNNLTFAVSSTGAWAWTSTVTGSIVGYTTNVWYHTAVVKSGNTLALYWNGTRVGFNASFTVPIGYGGSMFIGSYFNDVNNDQSYIRGYLSNFRMVAGTAIYSGTTYSIPTSPLTAVANTVMLLSSSSYVPVPPSYVQVGVGTQDTYALRPDGTLWAWGLNTFGQVGDGTTITRSSPTMLFAAGRWSSLGIGKVNTNYAISTAKGTQNRLFTWGLNTSGQSLFMDLANRSSPTQVSLSKMMQIPAPVRPDTSFNFVAAGTYNSMIRRSSDNISLIWGLNPQGEFGDRTLLPSSRSKPVIAGSYFLIDQSNYNLFPSSMTGAPKLVDFSPFANEPYSMATSGGSVEFNGASDSATISTPFNIFNIGTNDACMEIWAYWNTFRTNTSYMTLFGQNSGNVSTIRIQSNYIGNDASVRYTINDDTPRGETAILVNTWYHLVVTITNGVARFFVNGVLRDYVTGIGPVIIRTNVVENTNQSFIIGTEDNGWFNGYLSNFRFCNGSIPTLYQTASSTINNTIFSVPTSPLTTSSQGATAANVVLLCFTGSNLIDQGNGITLTLQNTVAINSTGQMYGIGGLNGTGVLGDGSATARSSPVQIGSSPTFRSINGTFFAPTLINSGSWSSVSAGLSTSTALRNDNTLWVWGFNTSGQLGLDDVVSKRFLNERFSVSDVSTYASRIYRVGTGYTTSIIPFAGAVAGSFNVVGLDVNEYLYLENPSQLTIGTSNFTIEVWIYPTLYNNLAYQIINWSTSPTPSLSFYFSATQTVAQSISGPVPLLNTWTHVVFQKQTNVIRLFFDGVEVATPNTDTTNYVSNALRPEIGAGSGGSFFNGYMSNLRVVIGTSVYRPGITVPTSNLSIVPATLATNTLMLTCQSATIIDNSIYALTITVNGQSNVQPLSPFASPGYSVLFDGSGDWLQFALSGEFNLTNFTNYLVECWFYATSLPAALKALVVAWPAVGSGPFYMGIDANNKMYIATGGINIAGSTTIVTNTWYHMCFIKNSSATVFGYLNGLTEIQSGGFTWASPGTVGVSIGGTTNGSNPFTGYISNVRIVKNILPYIASFPIPNSPLSTTVSAGNYTNQVTASQTVLLAYTSISSIALKSYLTASTKNTTHAITSDNNLYGTGINPNGQIGIAVVGNRSVPIQIGAIGQTINTYTNSPVQVTPGTSGYAQIWAGQSFSAARRTNNDVFTWGLGTSGQLGLGDAITRSSPTLMSSTQSWNQTVSVGYSHWVSVRYNKFDFLDSSTNNFTITQQGPNTEYSTTVIPFATAISVYQRLNDQGQLISAQTALSFSTGNFTIECWIFPTSVIGVFAGVVDARAAATASSWFFGLRNSASVYKVELYLAGIAQNTAATTIQLNVWTHIAATRNSGTVNIWVNGVSDLTGAGQTAAVNAGGTNQFVGRLIDTPAYAFPGYISNLRIVKGVAVYTGAFTVPTSPLDATQSSGVNINAITGTQTSLLTFRTEASSITWQANNKMYVQGGDGSGQLGISSGGTRTSFVLVGNGTTINSGTLSPIQVGFGLPASWTSVSAGTSYSYARNNLGQVYVWGRNTSGVLATADTINRSSPTLLGASSVLVDQSQYTNSITNSAVVYTSVIVPFNGAVSGFFNGSATLFMVGNTNLDIGAAYTIEFWYYPTALTGTVLSYGVSGALQSYQILWQGGSLVFRGSGSPGGSYAGNTFAFIDSNLMTINQWYYVTVISQANNNKLCFLNGNFAYVGAAGINSYSVTSPNGLTIGEGLQGYISNLRITKTDVYSTSFTSPNSPLQTSGATFTSAQVGLLILTAPSNITGQPDFNLVSAGGTHVVTTNSTNWMYTLGLNSSGQIGDNTTIDRLSPVLIGNYFNTNTISPILAASASWSSVSSGTSYNLAINSNGTLWAWGLNNIGQLGSNDTINRSSIIQIGTSSFSLVRAGHSTSVAIDATSRLFAWGLGTSGQLDNNAVINRSSPIQIGTSSWTIVATGNTTVGGILIDGLLYVWGAAALGKTGTSTLINRSSPTIVQGINYETKSPTLVSEYWASISAGLSFTLGIANNSLYTWGLNSSGQLGLGDTINRSSPTLLGAAASITDGSVNNYTPSVQGAVSLNSTIIPFSNTASLYFNGSSYLNYSDAVNLQFGTGTFTIEMFIRTPTVGGIQRILSKGSNAGTGYTLGVSTSNFAFVLESTSYDHPTTLIANTWYHVAVTRDSADDLRLFVNGISSGILLNTNYDFNQTQNLFVGIARGAQTYPYTGYVSNLRIIKGTALYVSNFTPPTSPLTAIAGTQLLLASTTVPDLYGSTFAGSAASFAIKQDGTLFAWGLGTTGQTSGYWSAIDRSTPNQIGNNYISVNPSSPVLIAAGSWSKVAAGNSVSAAIRNDGRLFTWGNLVSSGQLGDGTTISKSSPVAIGSSSWTQISAYDTHMMALTTTGQLFGWGLNASGQLGQINTINRSLPVQVGPTYFLTVKDSSTYNTNIQVFGTSYSTTVIPSLAGSVSGYFNGAGDYIQVPATTYNVNIGRSDFTIEFWINPTTMTNSTNIFTYGGYAESEGIGIDFLSNGIRAYLHNVNQSVVTPFMQTSTLTIGIWYHIACVRIGYNFYGYLNGVATGAALSSTKIFTNDYALRIGCGDLFNATIDPANFGNFYISNFRLVIGVGIYTGNFTVPTSILTTTVSAGANIQAVTSSQTALLLYTTLAASLSNTSVVSWNSIGTGSSFTAAITASGRLYTWGLNSSGQLGLGNTINRSSPTQIGSGSWISVASGGLGIESAIRNDGALFNWGLNGAYQLGNLWDTVNRSSPVQVGNNYAGQGTIFTRVPFKVNNLSWKQVSAGNSITSAISAQDRLFAWGLNTAGQVDQNSTTNRSDPTQVGSKQYLQTTAGASNVGAVGKAT